MIHIGQRPRQIIQMSAPKVRPEWRGIVEEELSRFQCSYRDACSKSRAAHIVKARWAIYRRLDDERAATSWRMRELFGQHHTTILNALGMLTGDKRARR